MHHLIREDGPLSHLKVTVAQNRKQEASQGSTSQPISNYLTVKDLEDAQAIAKGVNAWKILVGMKRRETQGAVKERSGKKRSPTPTDTRSLQDHSCVSGSVDESNPNQTPKEKSKCPFATLSDLPPPGHEGFTGGHGSRSTKRPDSLPTPPEWREEFISDSPENKQQLQNFSSPPASATGSASKCPIRFLDERSPEDIARYFETHKHEIPRSHKVCVKRYQSNEESIRQLDAKYGNLVSMIQGLGVTHKPLLPAKEEEESIAMERRSMEKVEKWADNVKDVPENASTRSAGLDEEEDREGHFDRPLEEVRVGESPSRPWGIRIPIEREIASSAFVPSAHLSKPVRTTEGDWKEPDQAEGEETAAVSNEAEAPYPSPPVSEALKPPSPATKTDQPRMLFTGPVFIGYPAEQAVELIKRCGMGVDIPRA